jgi:metal-sulfur cluster biosynthetic enzyme
VSSVEAAVRAALDVVRDPELDEAITELGFVSSIEIDEGTVRVRLRLPTYFCAPNFAWLMVADAAQALAAVPGVAEVDVRLDDHFASREINAGVVRGTTFRGAFPGLADGELADLRTVFRRKAFLARQHRLLTRLRGQGMSREQVCALRIGDLQAAPETAVYLQRRTELGLPVAVDAPVVVTVDGDAVAPHELDAHLARIRTVSVSIEGNAGLCRGLLATRYQTAHAAVGGGADPIERSTR